MDGGTRSLSATALAVRGLTVQFGLGAERVTALQDVSFDLRRAETLALVGESGSGKSLTALSIMGLLPVGATVTGGQVLVSGEDLVRKTRKQLVQTRGRRVAMVFQEPMTSLNPVLTIGRQLTEGLEFHLGADSSHAEARAVELLRLVGLDSAPRVLRQYPHQLSGGMRQRVMIAMALSCEPDLIIADEPTTALDVSIQAQIIDLLLEIKSRLGTAILLITHDLGVVAEMADRVVVLYAGQVVEVAEVAELFDRPRHPYSEGLLAAVPRLDQLVRRPPGTVRLAELPGAVPAINERPPGCPFMPRCPLATTRCREARPPMTQLSATRAVACWERAA
jgi:oligopeptide/dipeptide ABC transporter ATP-binding protein